MAEYPILQFDGVNQVLSSYKVPDNVGTLFINVDVLNKTLKSAKDYLDTGTSMGANNYWYKEANYDLQQPLPLSLAYLNGYVYSTALGNSPTSVMKRWNINTNIATNVGLALPAISVTLSETGGYYADATFTYAYYFYSFTYYDSATGEESAPFLTDVFGAKQIHKVLTISGINTSLDKLRIYRVGNYITKFTLVEEVDITTSSIVYTDTKADTELTVLLHTVATIPPPTGLSNLVLHQGTFYASIGSRLRFSKPGNANSWEALSFIDLEDDIIGLASINNSLIIFLRNKVFVLAGTDLTNYSLLSLMQDTGCVDVMSIASFRSFVVFLTDNGICITDGSTIQYVTRDIYTFPEGITVLDSDILTDRYFMLASDGFLYEVDFRGAAPMFLMYNNTTGITSLTSHNNELYGCATNIVKFFASTDDLELTYQTKDIVGNNYNRKIEVTKVSFTFSGDFLSSININNDIINKNIVSTNFSIADSYVPASSNETLSVSAKIVGKGEVKAINFSIDNMEG